MPVTIYQPPHSDNLAQAVGMWNQFMGPQSKLRAGEIAQQAAALPGVQAESQQRQLASAEGQQTLNAHSDIMNFDPGAVNTGLGDGHKITDKDAPFWHELTGGEQNHLFGSMFSSLDPKYRYLAPGVYNNWVTDRYHKLDSLMFPQGLDKLMGGAGGGPGGGNPFSGPGGDNKGYTNVPTWKMGADGKPAMELQKVIHQLSPDQSDDVLGGPNGWLKVPEAQQAQAKTFWEQHQTNLKTYRDEVNKDPAVVNYLNGQGEQPGILPLSQDLHKIADQYRDKNGNLTGNVDSQTAKAMAFKYARLLNPGMGVRDWELEAMAKGAGLYQELQQHVGALTTGNKIPSQVLEGMLNVTDKLKEMAQGRFEQSLGSWEQRLGPEAGLNLSDVVSYKPALVDYYRKTAPQVPSPEAATASLSPGSPFVLPDGSVGRVKGRARQSNSPTEQPAAPPGQLPPVAPATAAPPQQPPAPATAPDTTPAAAPLPPVQPIQFLPGDSGPVNKGVDNRLPDLRSTPTLNPPAAHQQLLEGQLKAVNDQLSSLGGEAGHSGAAGENRRRNELVQHRNVLQQQLEIYLRSRRTPQVLRLPALPSRLPAPLSPNGG